MKRALLGILVSTAALGSACYLGSAGTNDGADGGLSDGGTVVPFTADTPYVYISKTKNLLTGLPPTQAEVDTLLNVSDEAGRQAALVQLIDGWMKMPQYAAKMRTFFELAFQQTQINVPDFDDLVPNGNGIGFTGQTNLLAQNAREMFARTVLELVKEGKPLSAAFTTNTFMMTPPLMELYAFMEQNAVDDNEKVTDKFKNANPTISIIVQDTDPSVTLANSINASDPKFMQFYYPGLSTVQPTQPAPNCQAHSRTYPVSAQTVHYLLYGSLNQLNFGTGITGTCGAFGGNNSNSVFTTADFGEPAWKMVTIRPPTGSETTTRFYDVSTLRGTQTLILNTPRVGFYTTPAFQANWPTNTSNQMRATINQAFIVGLGAQVDGTDPTDPGANPPGLDQTHTAGETACVGCHRILDPSRSILQATYSYGYGQQVVDSGLTTNPGWFVFNGVVDKNVTSIADLGAQLANHVMYPAAWAQKLCFYANSQACDPTDPEFQRIVADFKSTGLFTTLVEDLFSSPIVTNAVPTQTNTSEGELVSVARRDHLCTLLDARLGLVDSCGLDIVTTSSLSGIPQIASGLPSDGYGRGASVPVLPAQPTLFFRAAIENICEAVALEIIDNTKPPVGAVTYSSASKASVEQAIDAFVTNLMGLVPSDPTALEMIALLRAHNAAVLLDPSKPKPTDALRSTFIVACSSPRVAGIGL